jgi:hypothetical protein
MIVRISGEDQYRVDPEHDQRLNELDNAVVAAVGAGDEAGYQQSFKALLEYVRANGTPVADDEIETSALILPPPDLSLAEAVAEFTGEGLIPD